MNGQHVRMGAAAVALAAAIAVVSFTAAAQGPQMTFFVTSVGLGDGANLGGLDGADAHCQSLAAAAGRGDATWRAYLSTQGENAVNARDRIGAGPWHAYDTRRQIAADLGWLHGDTLDQARIGNAIGKMIALTEEGNPVNGVGDSPNQHDILTGSRPDGTAFTDDDRPHLRQLDEQRRGLGAGWPFGHAGRRQQLVELDPPESWLQPGEPGEHRRRGAVLLLRDRLAANADGGTDLRQGRPPILPQVVSVAGRRPRRCREELPRARSKLVDVSVAGRRPRRCRSRGMGGGPRYTNRTSFTFSARVGPSALFHWTRIGLW